MNIGFWDNSLCERGTSVSLFDYAYHNEKLLGNKSFIFYDKNRENNVEIIKKFEKHFTVHETDDFKEVDSYLLKYNIWAIYIIKSGNKDSRLSKVAKNCIHCVFNSFEPHGEVYSTISPWINGNTNGQFPVVPHMIHLPNHNENMRTELHIPSDAIVFGGYGGKENFSIPFVYQIVYDVAKNHPNIYFLFANYQKFCPDLPNIIHLPMIIDLHQKVRFINTTDANLWARRDGETFGIAMGEFSSKNKPIICTEVGLPGHVPILGDKAIWYKGPESLRKILVSFNPQIEKHKDWNAYRDYTPQKVMDIFKTVFLT